MSDERVTVTLVFGGVQAVLEDDGTLRWILARDDCQLVADALMAAADGMPVVDGVVDVRGQG